VKLSLSTKVKLFLIIGLFASGNTSAHHYDKSGSSDFSPIDALERQLEMGRHEQLVILKSHDDSALTEFTTDGCSGGLSVGWEYLAGKIQQFQARHGTRPAWESCCTEHDQEYHSGGSGQATASESFDARKEADLALKACVLKTGVERSPELVTNYDLSAREVEILYTTVAELMYRSVRIGGMPCTGLPWRWGYGWPQCE
jgi:hypothetical protein